MKLNRRLFSSILIGNSMMLIPGVSFSNNGIRVYPSMSVLVEKSTSLNLEERKQALSHLVNNVTSDTEIEAFVDEIEKKLEVVPYRKFQSRKEQVLNSTVEGDIVNSFLRVDNFKAKSFVLNRLLSNEDENGGAFVFSMPVYLDGIAPGTYICYGKIMSSSVISGQDILDIVVSDHYSFNEQNTKTIGTLLSHLFIQKFQKFENIKEKEARTLIISKISNVYPLIKDQSKKNLLNRIHYICENVEYEMRNTIPMAE